MLNHYADAAPWPGRWTGPTWGPCVTTTTCAGKRTPRRPAGGGAAPLHTHIARLEGRRYFTTLEGEAEVLDRYVRVLTRLGFEGGVSVEAPVTSPEAWRGMAETSLRLLRRAFGDLVPEGE